MFSFWICLKQAPVKQNDMEHINKYISFLLMFGNCRSPVQSSLDWGDKVIGLNHPPTTIQPTTNFKVAKYIGIQG